MSLKDFAGTLPDFAKDIRLNVGSLLNEAHLPDQQKFGLLLACAHATGYKPLVDAAEVNARRSSRSKRPMRRAGLRR
jgi:alkyl hydroperoxide reductase subunit D